MRRNQLIGILLSVLMVITMIPSFSFAAGLPFKDVPTSEWYYNDVKIAYDTGLIDGFEDNTFRPDSNMTYAQAVKLAACMNQKYSDGSVTLKNGSKNWWDSYVEYAKKNKIISKDYRWNSNATRAGYVEIFAKALPDKALKEKNKIDDGAIPDVDMKHPQASAIYKLYRAGVLNGMDKTGKFEPDSNIRRSEVSAILTRMMNEDSRVTLTLDTEDEKKSIYTITFDYNYDNKGVYKKVEVKEGKTVGSIKPPSREGYSFSGWYTEREEGEIFRSDEVIKADKTLYAHWEKEGKEEVKKFDNGDYFLVPDKSNIAFDYSESVIYYDNLLNVYLFSSMSANKASKLASLVNGQITGHISDTVDVLQIKVPKSSFQELNAYADKIMEDDRVLYASYDYPIQMKVDSADSNPWSTDSNKPEDDRGNEDNPDGNDWWAEAINAYSAWAYSDRTSPISVGVIDNGFDNSHPDLGSKISFPSRYSTNSIDDQSPYHGTHVAGLIAAKNNTEGIRGVADQANLLCVDYTPDRETNLFSTLDYTEIFKEMIKQNIPVINISGGETLYSLDGLNKYLNDYNNSTEPMWIYLHGLEKNEDIYSKYLEYRSEQGKKEGANCIALMVDLLIHKKTTKKNSYNDFIIVQSAGNGLDNKGPGHREMYNGFFCSISELTYSLLPESKRSKLSKYGITYESIKDRKVIVGAVKDGSKKNIYLMTDFSNYGDYVDICAPGQDVFSTIINGSYGNDSGTSMAAPIVSGCLAYCWSLNPSLSAPEVKEYLVKNTSYKAFRSEDLNKLYPMVDLKEATEKVISDLGKNSITDPDKPSGTIEYNGHKYELYNNSKTWTDAKKYCEKKGGHLVTITSEGEQKAVESLIKKGNKYQYWLGASDERQEGNWQWVTNEKWNYTNWDAGMPDNAWSKEHYLQIYNRSNPKVSGSERFKWNDITVDNTYPNETDFFATENIGFICEWESDSNSDNWNDFIRNAEYKQYIDEKLNGSLSYAVYDLDGNGKNELLLEENIGSNFFNTWIFINNGSKIQMEKVDDEEYGNNGYGQYRFHPKKMELVANCGVKPDNNASWTPFYKLKNGKLELQYQVGMSEGKAFYSDNKGNNKTISNKERDSYYEGIIDLDWKDI